MVKVVLIANVEEVGLFRATLGASSLLKLTRNFRVAAFEVGYATAILVGELGVGACEAFVNFGKPRNLVLEKLQGLSNASLCKHAILGHQQLNPVLEFKDLHALPATHAVRPGLKFSGSGVLRRERLVLETVRRPAASRRGVGRRVGLALSDALLRPEIEVEAGLEFGFERGRGVGVIGVGEVKGEGSGPGPPARSAAAKPAPAPTVTAVAAAPAGVRAPYCFFFSGSGAVSGAVGSRRTGVPRGDRRSFRSLGGSGLYNAERSIAD
ncbi:hypothetical protein HG530_005087 [Fusarium avenaceum]|nr:hypothetical protein HG530_005087 [Fusarium avenaceum]